MHFNEQGRQVFRGQEALDVFSSGVGRLIREGRKLQGKTEFQGIPISIENRKGSIRSGEGPEGEWKTKMKHPYGYIKGTKGLDGDQLDCFVGPDENVGFAYVVHSKKPPNFKKDDEDKVMLGFSSAKTAKRVFLQHYDDPKFFGGMDTIPMAQFLDKAEEADSKKLVASRRGLESEVGVKGMKWGVRKGEDVEKSGVVYHGTSTDSVKEILKSGLTRKDYEGKVFVGTNPRLAVLYARGQSRVRKGSTPVVLKIEVPPALYRKFRVDRGEGTTEDSVDALFYRGSIPAKYISGVYNTKGRSIGRFKTADSEKKYLYLTIFLKGREERGDSQEAQEFGAKGQKWGQRKPEEKKGERPSAQKPWSAATRKKAQSLAADPRTMNMMQVARSAQLTMNNKARQQRVDSPPKLLHQEALGALKNQGWKIGGTMATKSKDGKGVLYSTGVANPSGGRINIYTLHTGTGFVHYAGKKANQPLYGQGIVKVRKEKHRGGQAGKPVRSSVREALRLREAKKKVIYYARPLSRYGTAQEAGEIQALKEMFPQFRIKAPKRSFLSTKGLDYYHDMAESADMIVVSPRRKNRLSAGVWSESRHAMKKKIPVFMIKGGSLSRIGKVKIHKKPDPIGDFGVAIRKYRKRSA